MYFCSVPMYLYNYKKNKWSAIHYNIVKDNILVVFNSQHFLSRNSTYT